MIATADFDEAYAPTLPNPELGPNCSPPECFVGSYPPVTPAGKMGPFLVNTYYLQPNRTKELVGVVTVRST